MVPKISARKTSEVSLGPDNDESSLDCTIYWVWFALKKKKADEIGWDGLMLDNNENLRRERDHLFRKLAVLSELDSDIEKFRRRIPQDLGKAFEEDTLLMKEHRSDVVFVSDLLEDWRCVIHGEY